MKVNLESVDLVLGRIDFEAQLSFELFLFFESRFGGANVIGELVGSLLSLFQLVRSLSQLVLDLAAHTRFIVQTILIRFLLAIDRVQVL